MPDSTQELCERGQALLMATDYLAAEDLLRRAETLALAAGDFDALSRLYMPLQEARRQRRLLCAEGAAALNLAQTGPEDPLDPAAILATHSRGQLLVAGWGSLQPAIEVRRLARERKVYVETFLAAVYPIGAARVVVLAPTEDVALPPVADQSIDQLFRRLPPHCLILPEADLPPRSAKGTSLTMRQAAAWWDQLHAPFLALARSTTEPALRIAAYRRTIDVDYACELAHQELSQAARRLDQSHREAR